ncbi:hypothetical protein ACFFIO_10620 [Citricoccus parietis]|uniref:Uncharacterized protein n=1 Tax=Citricoccus parietis TaxID=592307 RepID=A0ABV6F612_9MICC
MHLAQEQSQWAALAAALWATPAPEDHDAAPVTTGAVEEES